MTLKWGNTVGYSCVEWSIRMTLKWGNTVGYRYFTHLVVEWEVVVVAFIFFLLGCGLFSGRLCSSCLGSSSLLRSWLGSGVFVFGRLLDSGGLLLDGQRLILGFGRILLNLAVVIAADSLLLFGSCGWFRCRGLLLRFLECILKVSG